MSLDDLLKKTITIKEGIDTGMISIRIMQDFDLWVRVNTIMEKESLPKTHAVEKVAETCRVNEKTIWRAYSFTDKIMSVR
jgi:methenyltetrahydromethanopterin cyclohydrolase